MPEVSIIFGYRDRDFIRVQRCLNSLLNQTYTDFEVLFVDYGSSEKFKGVKSLIQNYSFSKYIYNHTSGMPWNRSHALNTGIRYAKGKYILFGDVDLIYSETVIERLVNHIELKSQVYAPVILLPEYYNSWDELHKLKFSDYPNTGKAGKGGVHLIEKKYLEEIRAYDEFYAFWGAEDRDLNNRLEQLGITDKWIAVEDAQIYHQWHPLTSNLKNSSFPDKWWEEMNIYYALNSKTLVRNDENWGKTYCDEDRPSLDKDRIAIQLKLNPIDSLFGEQGKTGITLKIIDSWNALAEGESLMLTFPKYKENTVAAGNNSFFKKVITKIFGITILGASYYSQLLNELHAFKNRENHFIAEYDISYIVWSLIRYHKIPCDYSIYNLEEHVQVTMSKLKRND